MVVLEKIVKNIFGRKLLSSTHRDIPIPIVCRIRANCLYIENIDNLILSTNYYQTLVGIPIYKFFTEIRLHGGHIEKWGKANFDHK